LCHNKNTGLWEEAGAKAIRKKVAQAFRDFHNAEVRKVNFDPNKRGHRQKYKTHHKTDLASNISNTCEQWQTAKKESQYLNENDVLLGRGSSKHFGNVMLRHLVTQNLAKYYNEPDKKDLLINEIIETMKNLNPPGRFLSQNKKTGVWEDVGDIISQQKLAQAFRDCRYAVMRKLSAQN
jgi:hypothetical protein